MTRMKTTWEYTETETETEKIHTTDTKVKQVITSPSNLPILNPGLHVEAQAQGTPEQPSAPTSESSSLSSEMATVTYLNRSARQSPKRGVVC
ncbi:hypothetical protein BDR06DRAFT_1007437 [Suillus hirtellus]|nr:hypothetical protein BDR06DRAFT_1007437 [Suillus hirtellus]